MNGMKDSQCFNISQGYAPEKGHHFSNVLLPSHWMGQTSWTFPTRGPHFPIVTQDVSDAGVHPSKQFSSSASATRSLGTRNNLPYSVPWPQFSGSCLHSEIPASQMFGSISKLMRLLQSLFRKDQNLQHLSKDGSPARKPCWPLLREPFSLPYISPIIMNMGSVSFLIAAKQVN